MVRLTDALAELAVPEPSDLDELTAFGDDLYSRVDRNDLANAAAVETAAKDRAPEFVALAEAAARAGDEHAGALLQAVADALPQLERLAFMDAADIALNSPELIAACARQLANALADRVDAVRSESPLQAYAYLEVLTRLGLAAPAGKFRALEVLSSVTLDDSVDFLERLPLLVGLAFDQWREDALATVLGLLLENESSRVDAQFEVALTALRSALEGRSIDVVMAGLAEARDQFLTVESMEEGRDDATVYRSALDVIIAFVGAPAGTGGAALTSIEALVHALAHRKAFSTRSALGGWATPRRQAEAEWSSLARILREATGPLGASSWLTPVETLSRVLEAYRASRSVTVVSADGLQVVLEPTVEAAFISRDGLLAHLRDALDGGLVPEGDVDSAHRLLDAVSSAAVDTRGGDAMGKVWASAPALAAELGIEADPEIAVQLAQAIGDKPELVERLNEEAARRERARNRRRDPVVDGLLAAVLEQLAGCEDLVDTVREEFVELLTEVLRFAADRADASRENWGSDIAYLFPPATGKPAFTEDYLQRDVFSWLASSGMRHHVRMEERDIASGRADITVTRDHRFVIEVKRERSDASRQSLLVAYGGQAAAYSTVGPRVSVEMVLDLTDHSAGVPSLKESVWVEKVSIPGADPRHVVTVVIRGNRPTPRQTRLDPAEPDER
ncbi:hypothetical protein [Promicromonospora sp. NPDC019610]|uniref:hypothetical protein n=1 Tax=Promicromonospora sp. NPDC019610 TaxID=3364405 RepID=UPI0037B8FF5A